MTSLNMGSMNFGLFPILDRLKEFRFDWERQHLENTRDFIFRNTYKDIERILKDLGEGHGVRFEFECYDVGHLYNLAHFLERGLVRPPLFVQTIFGILGGIGAEPQNLVHMRGPPTGCSAMATTGRSWLPAGTRCRSARWVRSWAAMCASASRIRIYLGKGRLAESNAQQVAKIRRILEELSLEIASPPKPGPCSSSKGGPGGVLGTGPRGDSAASSSGKEKPCLIRPCGDCSSWRRWCCC